MSDEVELYVGPVSVRDASLMSWQFYTEMVFSEGDIHHRSRKSAHKIVRQTGDYFYDDDPPATYHYFLASAFVVRKRLLIQGYTPEFCTHAWERARDYQVETSSRYITNPDGATAVYLRRLETVTFQEWLQLIRDEVEACKAHLLGGRHNPWNFRSLLGACNDVFVSLALLIEAMPNAPVWMDCSFLYHDDEAEIRTPHQMAQEEQEEFADAPSGKIIVLTEGKSDTRIITTALKAFYPEYSFVYQFLDFEEFRIEGGASLLARMIKVLSGARVQNRMIALFDNDAAGLEAYRSLAGVRFPKSVRLMLLPNTKLASNYPTLGPGGLRRMDVNGAGAPIELYLGRSSLKGADGKLRPVRWSQWIENARRYQGVIQEKEAVSRAFEETLRQTGTPAELRRRFPEMDQLLRSIFSAFEDLQPPIF